MTERVSTVTTNFPYAEYRNVNLPRAAELIDGTVLRPGETFSLNDIVGERTRGNGFTEGYVVSDGIFKQGPRRRRLADRDDDLQRDVLRRARGRRAQAALGLHRPLPRGPRGDGGVALPRPEVHEHHALRRADQGPRPQVHAYRREGAATVAMFSTKHWKITSPNGPRTNYSSPQVRYPQDARLRGVHRDVRFQRQRLPLLPAPWIWQGAPQGEVPHRLHRRRHRALRGAAEAEAGQAEAEAQAEQRLSLGSTHGHSGHRSPSRRPRGLLGPGAAAAAPARGRRPPPRTLSIAGANDWSCRPTAAHPPPVVIVHGTFGDSQNLLRPADLVGCTRPATASTPSTTATAPPGRSRTPPRS